MVHGILQILTAIFLLLLGPDFAFARVCDYPKNKIDEVAVISDEDIKKKCDQNIGAEADKIAREERDSKASACVEAYATAKREAIKYLDLRSSSCASIYEKSSKGAESCAGEKTETTQATCLEKVAANLKEAAAIEARLETALKSAKVSADAATNYSIKALMTLSDAEYAIEKAIEAERAKAVDANSGFTVAKVVHEAKAVSGGQLAMEGSGEITAAQAGPGVSTISGFKEKVPEMIRQQEEAASTAKNFSEETIRNAKIHRENMERFRKASEELAARAQSLKTAARFGRVGKSEDDSVPIPRPRPTISESETSRSIEQTRAMGKAEDTAVDPVNKSNVTETSGSNLDSDPAPSYAASTQPKGSIMPGLVGAAGAAGAVGGAYMYGANKQSSGLGTETIPQGILETAKELKSSSLAGAKSEAEKSMETKGDLVSKEVAFSSPIEGVGAKVGITGLDPESAARAAKVMGGASRIGGSNGFSGTGVTRLGSASSKSGKQDVVVDPRVKDFQTNLSEGGVPIKAGDLNSVFDAFNSEFGVDPSNGMTAEEQAAFSSLNNSGAPRAPAAAPPQSQFDASVEGSDGKALFIRTKLAMERAVKKGWLIQNLKNKL